MNGERRSRVAGVWRRVLSLSWPVMAEQVFRTLMRTTDIFVTALFSPAAVAAIGLADLYARFPLRIGLGLGGGAIALSSQDTGSGATANRDEAVSQALVIGVLAGLPFVAFGLLFGEAAIAVLGAPDEVARMGGLYLAVIFATAPFRHVALIGARSLQGTGDTRTPMYVNVASNVLNIVASLVLGLGLTVGPVVVPWVGLDLGTVVVPRLEIVGVGLATAFGNVFTALALLAAMRWNVTGASLARPSKLVIAKQLVVVSAPRVGEGLVATLAEFPFNSLLLGFGTEVNAAYQIGRRAYQQVTGPLSRGLNVAASVVVGQALGEGDPARARFDGWATAALGLVTVGTVGVGLYLGAPWFVPLFTDDPPTLGYAVDFARAYGLGAGFLVLFVVLSGALQGASDTRTPFLARVTGLFVFFLGLSYLLSTPLGWGVTGVYVGIVAYYAWAFLVVAAGFRFGDWATRATDMMEERGSAAE